MGITLQKLQHLRDTNRIPDNARVLDIGSSNLYSASVDGLLQFARSFGKSLPLDVVERISEGSAYGPNGGINLSFVGDLLERVGLSYLAFDIANGFRTSIFDLNCETLPDDLRGTFDLVLNFGTTEHVINQMNSLQVIHDAVKVGGYIVHELPTVGYVDHGYFCYTPRLFFDLASQNDYELAEFSYQGGAAGNDVSKIVADYRAHFPALAKAAKFSAAPQNISSFVVLRKMIDRPLRLSMETSTSVFTNNEIVSGAASNVYAMPFGMLTSYWLQRLRGGLVRRARSAGLLVSR